MCDSPRTGCAWRTTPYIHVARTSNNRVIVAVELYCCLLPQCEALRICRSGFPIATQLWDKWPTEMFYRKKTKQISPRGPYKPHCFYPRVRSLRRRACFLFSASSQESHMKNLNIAPDACSLKLWLTRWLAAHEQWLRRRCNKLDTAVVTIIVPWPPAKTCEITTIFQNFYLHFVHRTLYYNQNDVTCQCGDSPHITLNS